MRDMKTPCGGEEGAALKNALVRAEKWLIMR
jgi:hypothetical protein